LGLAVSLISVPECFDIFLYAEDSVHSDFAEKGPLQLAEAELRGLECTYIYTVGPLIQLLPGRGLEEQDWDFTEGCRT